MPDKKPDKLIGEIVQGRFAILERTGADRYKVYDMKELCQLEMLRWDDHWLPLPPTPKRALPQPVSRPVTRAPVRSAPPPIPAAALAPLRAPLRAPAAAPPASSGRARLATGRFEAAWFARGEALEQGEADPEVTDYTAYQAHLEAIAAELEEKRRGQRSVLLFAVPEPC